MRLNTSDLRVLSDRLLSHLEQNGHSVVEVSIDYYWNIPEEQRYNPAEEPTELDIGQLEDDWLELQKIAQGENEPIGYALVWLAAILQAIGETQVS